jgi:hypothetical protein
VAAAADLQSAMQEGAIRFQKETGKTVKVIMGRRGTSSRRLRTVLPLTSSSLPSSITRGNWKPANLHPSAPSCALVNCRKSVIPRWTRVGQWGQLQKDL